MSLQFFDWFLSAFNVADRPVLLAKLPQLDLSESIQNLIVFFVLDAISLFLLFIFLNLAARQ